MAKTYEEETNWQSDMNFDLRYSRWLLKSIGIWPLELDATTRVDRILEKFFVLATLFFLGMLLFPHGSYIFLIEREPELRLKMFGPLSFCTIACSKYAFALAHKRGIASCVARMAEDWRQAADDASERELMVRAGRWCDNFSKICVGFMYGGSLSYSVFVPLLDQLLIILSTSRNDSSRTLPFPCYFGRKTVDVYTPGEGLMFNLLFITHSLSIAVICTISSGLCTLMAKFVMHASSQLEIIVQYLNSLVEDEKCGDYAVKSRDIVVKHLRVLRFIKDVETTLTAVCFVEFIGSTLNICLCGYYFIKELERNDVPNAVTYMSVLISFVSNIFVFCYLGERLMDQCQKVGLTSYEVDWTLLLAKEDRLMSIEMIIIVSQNPPKLTAGKIINLTMDSFASVMKVSAT